MSFRSFRPIATLVAASAWITPGLAFAQVGGSSPTPLSADPEMVNIRFGKDAIPGVPVPSHDVANTVHFGTFFQYELNPVTGYRLDDWAGNIVINRVLRTKPHPTYEAGDRTGRLPDVLPLDYSAFVKAFEATPTAEPGTGSVAPNDNVPAIPQIGKVKK